MSFLRNIFRALSRVEKRVLLAAGALIAIGAGGLLFVFIKNYTVAVPAYSGAYSEGVVGQPSYVNPVLAASDDDQALVRLLFADLKTLADSIETSADGRSIKARLKQGLLWSDGQPLTSDDVVFTLQSIQNADSRSPLAGLFDGVKAERISALEVDFRIENVALAAAIPDLRPAPKHLYGEIPLANWRLSNYNLNPIASGPYVFSSNDVGVDGFVNSYRLTANASYAGAKPYIQKTNFLFFRNEEEVLDAFNNGQIQGFATLESSLLEGIRRSYDLTRFKAPTVYAVFWNQTTNPALTPIETRWALNLAVDRSKVLGKIGGYGDPVTGPVPPAIFEASDAPAKEYPAFNASSTNPNEVLEKKGWQKGEDGIWAKKVAKSTVRLEFSLTVPDIDFLKAAAEELAAEWQAFGAKVNLKVLPPDSSLLDTITNRGYDGLLFGNTIRGKSDLYPFWHSSERFAPGLNLAIYRNTRVDTLLEGLRKEANAEKRQKDLESAIRLIMDDEAAVFLFSLDSIFISTKNLEGVSAGFLDNPADRMRQLPQWYVNTRRQLK